MQEVAPSCKEHDYYPYNLTVSQCRRCGEFMFYSKFDNPPYSGRTIEQVREDSAKRKEGGDMHLLRRILNQLLGHLERRRGGRKKGHGKKRQPRR